MICYNCGFNITDSHSKECHFCGAKFGHVCSNCKAPNPPMGRYCFNCGKSLQQISSSGNVQNFGSLSEARKNVAIIFADVSGFTALSEKLDPEVIRELINDCFNYITKPVYELDGTIDKFIGDCVMILFGAHTTHSDDAKRAVLCAMKMMSLVKEFSEQRVKSLGFDLDLSIGIHYGLVVTGVVGNYFDKDYTVMGDTVNTAQRIQSQAPKSVIYVSDAVYTETGEDFTYSNSVSFFVKNKKDKIKCYIPLKISNTGGWSKANTPFVGRNTELLKLTELYNSAMAGNSRTVMITGAAGIGKSRLATQFIENNENENIKIIQHECIPPSVTKPYSLLSGLLMNIMNINPGDAMLAKHSRIISYISFILGSADEEAVKRNAQFLGLIIGLETDREFQRILNAMDTKAIQNEIRSIITNFFKAFGRKYKTCILLEDIHWGDNQSLSILKKIIAIQQSSILYILTARNAMDLFHNFEKDIVNIIQLNSFESCDIDEITRTYIGCTSIERTFVQNLERVSGGNPIYLYEFLTYLRKNNLYYIQDNIAIANWDNKEIPGNLQSLILSNLNNIAEDPREMIQVASIIGKDFTLSLLNHLLNRNAETNGDISAALESNLISLKNRYTHHGHIEKLYTFNHETERETIYNSILIKQKKDFHKKAGEAIEQLYEKNLESYYELLGDHFEKADNAAKAAAYYYDAANNYKARYNYPEALDYYQKSLELYHTIKQTKQDRLFVTYKEIGELLNIMSRNTEAIDYANKAMTLTQDNEDAAVVTLLLVGIYKDQGKYEEALKLLYNIETKLKKSSSLYSSFLIMECLLLRIIGKQDEALQIAKKSEKLLTRSKDYTNLAKTLNTAGNLYYSMGNLEQALESYNRSFQYADRVQDLQTLMKTASNLAIIYLSHGKIAKATNFFDTAIDLSKRLGHQQGYMTNCINYGILHIDKGYFNKARELFETTLRLAQEAGAPFMESVAMTNLGDVAYHIGNYEQTQLFYQEALGISTEIDDIEGQAVNNLALARIAITLAQYSRAYEYINISHHILQNLESSDILCDYYYYLSLYQSKLQNWEDAMDNAKLTQNYAASNHVEKKVGRGLRLQGIILQNMGQWEASLQLFDESIAIFEGELSDYELAKSYYLKSISCSKIGLIDQSVENYETALKKIENVDMCRWTKIIKNAKSS